VLFIWIGINAAGIAEEAAAKTIAYYSLNKYDVLKVINDPYHESTVDILPFLNNFECKLLTLFLIKMSF